MPAVDGRKNSGFKGKLTLKRFSPPVFRITLWEYEEPYRLGRSWVFHIPGLRSGWLRGCWDDSTAKDSEDDHEAIMRHLMEAIDGRVLRDDELVQ